MPRNPKPPRVRIERGLHKQGDTWYASATPPGSRRETFRSLGKGFGITRARLLRDQAVQEIRNGRPTPATGNLGPNATFTHVKDTWLDHKRRLAAVGKLSDRTITDSYRPAANIHLEPWFAEHRPRVRHITDQDLLDWYADQLEADAADWSIKGRWTVLTGILSYAVRQGVIATNPCDLLEAGERPGAGAARQRFLDDDEIAQLLHAAHTPRWRLLVALLLFAGLRISEVLALQWTNIDFDEGVIRVRQQLGRDTKLKPLKTGNGSRDVVLMDALAKLLRRYKLHAPNSQEHHPVIATISGRHVTQRNATREFTRIVDGYRRARVDRDQAPTPVLVGVTPHVLRHTFASLLVYQGRDVAFVSDQLGHADPSITLRVYAKLFRAAKQRAQARQQLDADYGHLLRGNGSA